MPKHLRHDLRHRQVLENPLVVAELQVVQRRHQGQMVASQAFTGFPHRHIFDTPVNAFAIEAELEKCGLAEQAFQIEIRVFADQFHLDRVQSADGLATVKGRYLEIVTHRGYLQREVRRVGRSEHTLFLKQRGNEARYPNRPWSVRAKSGGHVIKEEKEFM